LKIRPFGFEMEESLVRIQSCCEVAGSTPAIAHLSTSLLRLVVGAMPESSTCLPGRVRLWGIDFYAADNRVGTSVGTSPGNTITHQDSVGIKVNSR
jgi:hypothetical protein